VHKYWLVLLALSVSCGSKSQNHELSGLEVTRLSVTAGFDLDEPDAAQIFASVTYTRLGADCPELPITAELDGVPLVASPNGTGRVGSGCQLGFYLDVQTSEAAEQSTLSFRDDTAEVSFTVDKLLAPHALVSDIEQNTAIDPARGVLSFAWSVASDQLSAADAYFKQGSQTIQGEAQRTGNNVDVQVPELTPGSWRVELGAVAAAKIASCSLARECSATIAGNGALAFTIE
jgi:hypothetical protein